MWRRLFGGLRRGEKHSGLLGNGGGSLLGRDTRGPCRGLLGELGLAGFFVGRILVRAWTRFHSQEWLCYWALSDMSGWNGRLGIALPLCRFVGLLVCLANNPVGLGRLVLGLGEFLTRPAAPGY